MDYSALAAWAANFIALIVIIISLRQIHSQQKVAHSDAEYQNWAKIDELMFQYPDPDIHEVLIGPDIWLKIKNEFSGKKLVKFLKQRALSAQLIGLYWWSWQIRKETKHTIEGDEIEDIPLADPILIEMWWRWGIRNDYEGYPHFIEFMDKKLSQE